ncbi:MAG TPA: amino acid ABC transporter permease [Jiangellales bacterium]|nr:amino acid ABC transporter permease [Jiangellales bacterium]
MPRRHYGQSAFAVVAIVLVVALAVAIYRNPNIDHPTIAEFVTAAPIMQGLVTTIQLTVLAALIGSAIGLVVALLRMSDNRVLRGLAWLYLWFFRGVPLLVQILFWGNIGLFFRHLEVGVPFTDIQFFRAETATVITTFVASVIGLALHESAYLAEIFRGGILAVDHGQTEAAQALGMTRGHTFRRIVLPQALRVIVPPAGNQYISLLKASSLVSVIAGGDLLTRAENIGAVTLRSLELLAVATFWYLVIVSLASIGQHFVEQRFARGYAR